MGLHWTGIFDEHCLFGFLINIEFNFSFRIRSIPGNFLELPIQSIYCELAGIHPPNSSRGPFFKDTKWPIGTIKTLYQIVADKRMVASILVCPICLYLSPRDYFYIHMYIKFPNLWDRTSILELSILGHRLLKLRY